MLDIEKPQLREFCASMTKQHAVHPVHPAEARELLPIHNRLCSDPRAPSAKLRKQKIASLLPLMKDSPNSVACRELKRLLLPRSGDKKKKRKSGGGVFLPSVKLMDGNQMACTMLNGKSDQILHRINHR